MRDEVVVALLIKKVKKYFKLIFCSFHYLHNSTNLTCISG